jgi:mono/diheme cytochrome c family protein
MSYPVLVLWVAFSVAAARAQGNDWTIPSDAATLASPVAPNAAVLKRGQELFKSNCEKCHGPLGRGDGRYADPQHLPADLTQSSAADNPDGVLFYRIWNGKKPMPAFKSTLTRDEAWTLVEYAKSLRAR